MDFPWSAEMNSVVENWISTFMPQSCWPIMVMLEATVAHRIRGWLKSWQKRLKYIEPVGFRDMVRTKTGGVGRTCIPLCLEDLVFDLDLGGNGDEISCSLERSVP
jgi:hypothetical protein